MTHPIGSSGNEAAVVCSSATELTLLGDVWLTQSVRTEFASDQLVLANLEAPITNTDSFTPRKILLRSRENHLRATFGDQVAVSLANNHMLDHGLDGLQDTLRELDQAGIPYAGAGLNIDGCRNPLLIELSGEMVGVICCSQRLGGQLATETEAGVFPADPDQLQVQIQRLQQQRIEHILVVIHWGQEEVYLPKPSDMELGRQLVDWGATAVIGHHAHRIQAAEMYQGSPIFYGLGNAIFPDVACDIRDEQGQVTVTSRKRQLKRNQVSLAVSYSPRERNFRVDRLYFDGQRLRVMKRDVGQRHLQTLPQRGDYQKQFARSVRWGRLSCSLLNFLASPRLPRSKDFGYLLSLAGFRTRSGRPSNQ